MGVDKISQKTEVVERVSGAAVQAPDESGKVSSRREDFDMVNQTKLNGMTPEDFDVGDIFAAGKRKGGDSKVKEKS